MLLVTVLISDFNFASPSAPPHRHVYHWSKANWGHLSHYFSSTRWDMSGCVDLAVSHTTVGIVSVTRRFVPSCIPKMIRPTPWWNHHCDRAWQRKMLHWKNCDVIGFHCATLIATRTYARAFKDYKFCLMNKLRESPTD